MPKVGRRKPYAEIKFFTDDGKLLGEYTETDQMLYDTLKTRHNELTMKGLNKTGDTTVIPSIRGR